MGQQQAAAAANAAAANRALEFNYGISVAHDRQETEAAIAEKKKFQLAGLEARSTAEAASAEAGVGGISVDSLINEYHQVEGRNVATIDRNLRFSRFMSDSERRAGQIETQNRIDRIYRDLPNPSLVFLGALARAGGEIGGAYYKFTTPVTNPDGSRSRRFG